ncbi:putative uncharacterized protein DDB_G0287191 [Schistocerca piceifrons]|uniref:putative uncharacterized protein DDB_G0287191 n=1 Tax=Schistocerca piceifrons TaxID=274613 RepID=UPI001F5E8CB4|nr:putative uncharacterized protein DDB_G0287191 [Schistocerca piceifrons]
MAPSRTAMLTLLLGLTALAAVWAEPSGPLHQHFIVRVPYPIHTVHHHKVHKVPVHHYFHALHHHHVHPLAVPVPPPALVEHQYVHY